MGTSGDRNRLESSGRRSRVVVSGPHGIGHRGCGEEAGGGGGSVTRTVRRTKLNAEKKLGYVRLQGTGRGALDHRVRVRIWSQQKQKKNQRRKGNEFDGMGSYSLRGGLMASIRVHASVLDGNVVWGGGTTGILTKTKSLTIGRKGGGADCQLKVESRTVSRLHARLEYSDENRSWMIHCLSKKNGVLVDGVPIAHGMPPLPLQSRQLIELGEAALYFLEPRPPLIYTHNIEKTEKDIQRKRKAKEDAEIAARRAKARRKVVKKPVSRTPASRSRGGPTTTAATAAARRRRAPAKAAGAGGGERGGAGSRGGPKASGKSRGKASAKPVVKKVKEAPPKDAWTKREKSEFLRAIFASGVKKDENEVFDWKQFRANAGGLPNKEDINLKEYYDRLMKDVELLVDTANRSKKESGRSRRTKHKESCECVICEHSRKKAARIAAGTPRPDDLKPPPPPPPPPSEDKTAEGGAESKDGGGEGGETGDGDKSQAATATAADAARDEAVKNALVGLVTAQKLRVRLGLIEAANAVDTAAGIAALARLTSQPIKPAPKGETLPEWWEVGKHDRELMLGVARGGVGKWTAVWEDESLEGFAAVKAKGEEMPNDRAAMRRFREVSSAILTEKRRRARRGKASATGQVSSRKPATAKRSAGAAVSTGRGGGGRSGGNKGGGGGGGGGRVLKLASSDESASDGASDDDDDDDDERDDDEDDDDEDDDGDHDDDDDDDDDDDNDGEGDSDEPLKPVRTASSIAAENTADDDDEDDDDDEEDEEDEGEKNADRDDDDEDDDEDVEVEEIVEEIEEVEDDED